MSCIVKTSERILRISAAVFSMVSFRYEDVVDNVEMVDRSISDNLVPSCGDETLMSLPRSVKGWCSRLFSTRAM